MGKKSGPAAPAAPDPVATARAQTGMNIASATAQANLDRINQVTPQGNLTYTINGYNSDGTPRYTQTQTYSPDQQQLYDQNNQVAAALNGTAISNLDRVNQAQSTPFTYDGMTPIQTDVSGGDIRSSIGGAGQGIQDNLDYSNLTKLPGVNDFSADGKRVADSVYAQAASRLDPQYKQAEDDQRARLAAQGITENSDAYRRDQTNLGNQRTDAYNQANYSAIQAGANEQSRLFGLAMGARQQGQNEADTQGQFVNDAQAQTYGQNTNEAQFYNTAQNQGYNQNASSATFNNQSREQQIQEAAYLRNVPLNDIAALLSGNQPQSPQFQNYAQVGVAAPDYQGQVQNNYNAAMNQYNTAQTNRSQMLGSIFSTVGSAAAAMLSDRRFKENIKRIGQLANGLATYAFNYIGDKTQQFGVMAQEVLEVVPEAVVIKDGIMYVDYGRIY